MNISFRNSSREEMKKIRVVTTYFVPMGFLLAFLFSSNISIVYQGMIKPNPLKVNSSYIFVLYKTALYL